MSAHQEEEHSYCSDISVNDEGGDLGSVTEADGQEVKNLTRKDNAKVVRMRIVVGSVLVFAGLIVGAASYLYLRRSFQEDGLAAFHLFANTIEAIATSNFRDCFDASRAMGRAMTTDAISRQVDHMLPLVAFPAYEIFATQARERAGWEVISYTPFLHNRTQLDEFDEFTQQHHDWIATTQQVAKTIDEGLKEVEYEPGVRFPEKSNMFNGTGFQDIVGDGPFGPIFHMSPPPAGVAWLKTDLLIVDDYRNMLATLETSRDAVLGNMDWQVAYIVTELVGPKMHKYYHTSRFGLEDISEVQPHMAMVQPLFTTLDPDESEIYGFLISIVAVDNFLLKILPDGVNGIDVVASNSCGDVATYRMDGSKATFVGNGDLHDPAFDHTIRRFKLLDNYRDPDLISSLPGHCIYSFTLYATSEFAELYSSTLPLRAALLVAAIFALMAMSFVGYDNVVRKRNQTVLGAAERSGALVTSMFPRTIRDQLYNASPEDGEPGMGKPIADLYLDCTIMFCDIAGFTAWCSTREPSQVFVLLETLYGAFDVICKHRRIFKVETVGDSYVAAAGVPHARQDHAVVMARFAHDCLHTVCRVTEELEARLGPDTSDLSMRFGLHSGPVTAGVLRGERGRFQLFGDTMNCAARMESTGIPGRIQLSAATASLLSKAQKQSWLRARAEPVFVKGKGEMNTFFLSVPGGRGSSKGTEHSQQSYSMCSSDYYLLTNDKTGRLIEWNVGLLCGLLRQVIARRTANNAWGTRKSIGIAKPESYSTEKPVLQEVAEIIELPRFDAGAALSQVSPDTISLSDNVVKQLTQYVTVLAKLYKSNPFHNFEHASHVTMSVSKLLSRIVAPTHLSDDLASTHDHTYGITSDPLTQFACVLSALMHDADHQGVSNAQLAQENPELNQRYGGKSLAEQNSVNLSWALLMDECYADFRDCIFETKDELQRFRALIVNSVMATDIMDKDLKALRNNRWETAFSDSPDSNSRRNTNRKATIIIEHLIQASDVSHTMQHWHVYRRWNRCLFQELYKAYKEGRMAKDPSENWYKGELGFFDFYIIPLAKKLKDCGVFGVCSDEYLAYAMQNREEWELRGQEEVSEMIEEVKEIWAQIESDKQPTTVFEAIAEETLEV